MAVKTPHARAHLVTVKGISLVTLRTHVVSRIWFRWRWMARLYHLSFAMITPKSLFWTELS